MGVSARGGGAADLEKLPVTGYEPTKELAMLHMPVHGGEMQVT